MMKPYAVEQNFCRLSFRGRSFRGQNLANADFSHAEIQGTDFRDANLTGANFESAKAGLQSHWQWAFAIALFLFSGLSGFVTSLGAFWVGIQLIYDSPRLFTALVFFAFVLAMFITISLHRELLSAIGFTPLIFTTLIFLAGILTVVGAGYPTAGGAGAGVAAGLIAGATIAAVLITAIYIIAGFSAAIVGFGWMGIGSGIATWQSFVNEMALALVPHPTASSLTVVVGMQLSGVTGIGILLLTIYLVWRALGNDSRYEFVRELATAIATLKGTCFQGANLTQANFSHAQLKNCDFRNTIITQTSWYKSKQLEWARLGSCILTAANVRALLVEGKGTQLSYINANLQGANLYGFDLSYLNFKGANLSGAILKGACLEWANLAQTQAIGTDFSQTQMTGCCGLGTWNIDNSTQLEGIDCRWVYLLEQPKLGTDDRERRPSSGEFDNGEFTSLFRKVIDTVDLIFHNGIDWRVFSQSFQRIQVEHEAAQLEIQSIENKGNGIVVVKVRALAEVDKGIIHTQFMQFYQDAIALMHKQSGMLHQHEQDIQFMREMINRLVEHPVLDQVVILHIGQGTIETGFPVTLQILQDGLPLPSVQSIGELPPNHQIISSYQYWQSAYRRSLKASRLDVPSQVTNVSGDEFFSDCLEAAAHLRQQMNLWLSSESFRSIERSMQIQLNCNQPIRIILQTDHPQLRQLPWQTWYFFDDYSQAELALSKLTYRAPFLTTVAKPKAMNTSVRILAIFGDSRNIDLEKDQAALNALDAEVKCLITPQRQDVSATLWEQQWDILFFAGHSWSQAEGTTGKLWINSEQHLQIADIRYALTQAITSGLKLAIFNSCDGLGLANDLADLQIPQMIVMREPIPDAVAHVFLMNFLDGFSQGRSFYQAVRKARERLQEVEDQYPCATWLPVIVQNPTEIPLTWHDLKNVEV